MKTILPTAPDEALPEHAIFKITTTPSQTLKKKRTPMKTTLPLLLTACAALLLGSPAMPVRADILYAANYGNNTIVKFTGGGAGSVFGSVGGPIGLAFDSTGHLYTASGDSIVKFTLGGIGSVFASDGLRGTAGLAFDGAGSLYAANIYPLALDIGFVAIEKFTSSGVGSIFATGQTYGLAFDAAGNLYASNYNENTIEKFTPGGAGSVFASSGLNGPAGLAFDSAGNLYVSNYGDNTIKKFTPGGVGSVFASSGLNGPVGLAFDSAGNLYAANQLANSITEFTPGGVGSVFASGLDNPLFLAFTNDAGVPLRLANQVPEPATWAMLGLGIPALLGFRRRPARPFAMR